MANLPKTDGKQTVNGRFEPGNRVGKRFAKGISGNLRGRPPKFVTALKAEGYKQSEINDCICVMLSLTEKQLYQIPLNPNATTLELMIAAALRRSIKTGSLNALEILVSRAFGKPKEVLEDLPAPEIEAARAMYEMLIDEKNMKPKTALKKVIEAAKSYGFDLTESEIIDAGTIG